MVEIIGVATMSALVWLLAWSMGAESDSEKRRTLSSRGRPAQAPPVPTRARQAA